MTKILFVRHAESVYVENQERSRGLTEAGKVDAFKIMKKWTSNVDLFISSPYDRAIDTIRPLAEKLGKEILIEENLRERTMGNFKPLAFKQAKEKLYIDSEFSFPQGESSMEAQTRALRVVLPLLERFQQKTLVIGTHGDILTLMLNYFDEKYDFEFWQSTSMPDLYEVNFKGNMMTDCLRVWERD